MRASYCADPDKKKAAVRASYCADPDKKMATVRASYHANPGKKREATKQLIEPALKNEGSVSGLSCLKAGIVS